MIGYILLPETLYNNSSLSFTSSYSFWFIQIVTIKNRVNVIHIFLYFYYYSRNVEPDFVFGRFS